MVETESYPSDEEKAEVKQEEPPKKEKKPKRIYSVEEKKEIALRLKAGRERKRQLQEKNKNIFPEDEPKPEAKPPKPEAKPEPKPEPVEPKPKMVSINEEKVLDEPPQPPKLVRTYREPPAPRRAIIPPEILKMRQEKEMVRQRKQKQQEVVYGSLF
tara:strand:+ start:362 stop:832 length:471 start_codon:yes stop_codon:yes gene_type:complete